MPFFLKHITNTNTIRTRVTAGTQIYVEIEQYKSRWRIWGIVLALPCIIFHYFLSFYADL